MPGDTKIKRAPNAQSGWIDIDDPSVIFPTRRLARDSRRIRLNPQSWTTAVSHQTTVYDPPLTSLQARLYDRLTHRQGVDRSDALSVVTSFGYNAAASYGHMRAAGASHAEALTVISIGSPTLSLAYGTNRAMGDNHHVALRDALVEVRDDDDD